MRTAVATSLIALSLAAAGCGDTSDTASSETGTAKLTTTADGEARAAAQATTTAEAPVEPVAITTPAAETHATPGSVVRIAGTGTPGAQVTISDAGEIIKERTAKVDARGRWSTRVRMPNDVSFLGVMATGGNDDDVDDVLIRRGKTKGERAAARAKAARRAELHRLRKGGPGSTQGWTKAKVRRVFGNPDHTQRISGQSFWYYERANGMWQLVFSGDVVGEANRY